MKRKHLFLLVLFLGLSTSAAFAQRFEIMPFGGYRFGGDTNLGIPQEGDTNNLSGDVTLKNGFSYGLVVDYRLNSYWQVELLVDHQATEVLQGELNESLVELGTTYLHGGLMLHSTSEGIQPFILLSLGTTLFSLKDDDNSNRFSAGVAGGIKYFLSERFGLRIQTRLINTFLGANEQFFCDELKGCYTYGVSSNVLQMDISGGLIIVL